jgi:hypothetical protein
MTDNNEWERMWKEEFVSNLRYYSCIYLEELSKINKTLGGIVSVPDGIRNGYCQDNM